LRRAPDGRIFFKTFAADGSADFWSVAPTGGAAALVARLSDPDRPASRAEFSTDGHFIYTSLFDRQSDVYVAKLVKK
jgi:hypothetical protein